VKPLYPLPLKPATRINTWTAWPPDVEPILRDWHRNRGHLTFTRGPIFKCVDCTRFCEAHQHGAAVLKGDWLCDECLIARARAQKKP
jgi:hypothetical protein